MKTLSSLLCLIPALIATAVASDGRRLDVEVVPRFGETALAFDTLGLETASGQRVSVTRFDLLLTGAALRRDDGTWIGAGNWAAYLNTREGRTRFALANVPAGKFTRLKFNIGVPPALNHADTSGFPAGHPLNPTVNNLHWGWQGGYIFAAIEGLWRAPDGAMAGYSYHLANDENLMTVELPLDLDLTADQTLKLGLDLRKVFGGLVVRGDQATTHSRAGDEVAYGLRDRMAGAFTVSGLSRTPTRTEAAARVNALIGPQATPYRFTFPAAFPRPSLPPDNPLTNEGVALGSRLFHDTRLSGNLTQSCASCHEAGAGFSDPRRFSIGASGGIGTRQAMPVFNLAWKSSFFWDGRKPTVREQSLEPIENPVEMHASLPEVVKRLSEDPSYRAQAEAAFGRKEIDREVVSRALEQFVLSIVSGDSKFDRAMRGAAELTAEERRGSELFNTEFDPVRGQRGADCFHCHGGPLFQSTAFANNGLDVEGADRGRAIVTGLEGDRGKFSVPSLRNVALTAPYMHDGRFATLEEVVAHYDHGLKRSPTLDPNLAKHPAEGLRLSAEDQRALVAFLRTLTQDSGR